MTKNCNRDAKGTRQCLEDSLRRLRTDRLDLKPIAGDGRHERFKSTQFFDSDYHKKQHGLTKATIESP